MTQGDRARMHASRRAKGARPEESGEVEVVAAPALDAAAEERKDSQWVAAHYAELVDRYPFAWVAVRDKHVIGHGATRAAAERDAARNTHETFQVSTHFYFLERSAEWFADRGAP